MFDTGAGNLRSGFGQNVQVRAKTSNRFLVVPYRHASIHRWTHLLVRNAAHITRSWAVCKKREV